MKKVKGFTIIELIVVMAIIAVLAAVFVPILFRYVKTARVSKLNSNARHVYGAAIYTINDYHAGFTNIQLQPDCIYVGGSDGIGYASDGSQCNITNYLAEGFEGYFAFVTDSSGISCLYALWSNKQISASDVRQLNEQDVEDTLGTPLPMGCYPHKVDP